MYINIEEECIRINPKYQRTKRDQSLKNINLVLFLSRISSVRIDTYRLQISLRILSIYNLLVFSFYSRWHRSYFPPL